MASFTKQSDGKSARGRKRKLPDQPTDKQKTLEPRSDADQLNGSLSNGMTDIDHIDLFDGRGGGQVINSQERSRCSYMSSVNHLDKNIKLHHHRAVDIICVDTATSEAPEPPLPGSNSNSSSILASDRSEGCAELKDDAILTDGILPLIDKLSMPNTATCHYDNTANSAADDRQPLSTRTVPNGSLNSFRIIHYKQNDKWSCGFRNMQMILSALLPIIDEYHPYFQNSEAVLSRVKGSYSEQQSYNRRRVPSLSQIQIFLEQSWADGFDPRGAKHYKNRIRGRKSQIGAVEVSSTLSYLRIDSVVAQFILCHESRSLLGKFVWSYFTRKVGRDACFFCTSSKSSRACGGGTCGSSYYRWSSVSHATELLRLAEDTNKSKAEAECCQCPLLPLYLQWEGHSVTIVGIKNATPSGVDSNVMPQFSLVVFDPLKEGSSLKDKLHTSLSKRQNRDNDESISGYAMQNENDEASIATMYLPVSKLLNEDCQIVMCSARPLSISERQRCRERANAVTAASRAIGTKQD